MRLSGVCSIFTGYTARGQLVPAAAGGIPVIQLRDLANGWVDPSKLMHVQLGDIQDRHLARPGDVLFRSRGDRNTAVVLGDELADPTFYRRFSELLQDTIRDYKAKRISERDYLKNVIDLAGKVARKDRGIDVPDPIKGNDDGQAFYGILQGALVGSDGQPVGKAETAHTRMCRPAQSMANSRAS